MAKPSPALGRIASRAGRDMHTGRLVDPGWPSRDDAPRRAEWASPYDLRVKRGLRNGGRRPARGRAVP
jgi:hypothetical protein